MIFFEPSLPHLFRQLIPVQQLDDYMEDGIFIYLGEKTICSEIIIDGMRLSDKFDNVILERQFVNPSHDLYIDLN